MVRTIFFFLILAQEDIALIKLVCYDQNPKQTTSVTLWQQDALKIEKNLEEGQIFVMNGFESKNKTKYDHSSLDFVLKKYGNAASVDILADQKINVSANAKFDFVPNIKSLLQYEVGDAVDVLGIIYQVQSEQSIENKFGKSMLLYFFMLA